MKRAWLLLLVAPVLLAPVRLKDATPSFFSPPAESPAPEAYSLPAADPLVPSTVIEVTPTVLKAPTPTVVVTPSVVVTPTMPVTGTLSLPLPPTPTTVVTPTVVVVAPARDPNAMTETEAALCMQAMALVQDMTMLSYEQKRSENIMTLFLAATAASGDAENMQWPVMNAFVKAAGGIPFFQPQKAELKDAAAAGIRLCTRPGSGAPVFVPRPE